MSKPANSVLERHTLRQIDKCCSWKTDDDRFQVDYWANANRPGRGYGMYTVSEVGYHGDKWDGRSAFTSKAAAFAEVRRRYAEGTPNA